MENFLDSKNKHSSYLISFQLSSILSDVSILDYSNQLTDNRNLINPLSLLLRNYLNVHISFHSSIEKKLKLGLSSIFFIHLISDSLGIYSVQLSCCMVDKYIYSRQSSQLVSNQSSLQVIISLKSFYLQNTLLNILSLIYTW